MIEFYKYHGTGNDFIMIDNRSGDFQGDKVSFAQKWCFRRFGVGSDGVIFIENDQDVDYVMDFYNPDGSQSFCGNGSRCAMAFARFLGVVNDSATFKAIDGKHTGRFENGLYHIHMGDVHGIESIDHDYFLNTGSPHYISFIQQGEVRDIVEFGKKIRYSERFREKGTNVNLVKFVTDNAIQLRTYERGVENETLACGTGATAAALAAAYEKRTDTGLIDVGVQGGALKVSFNREGDSFTDVWLIGPAQFVFKGVLEV